jgi:hypothetical protein
MNRRAGIGATVPAWIRDAVRREEADWPWWALAAGLAAAGAALLTLGAALWTSDPPVYYVRP